MDKKYFVYRITNTINGKLYFGKTGCEDPHDRWDTHLATAAIGPDDHNRYQYLHRAINKYGKENFLFEVILECSSELEAKEKETYFIAKYNTFHGEGYNLTEGGDGASGYKHTKETRVRMSKIRKNLNLFGERNYFYGKKHTKEALEKISGENSPQARLTKNIVLSIRKDYADGARVRDLVKKYKLRSGHICKIVHRKSWKYI